MTKEQIEQDIASIEKKFIANLNSPNSLSAESFREDAHLFYLLLKCKKQLKEYEN